MPKKIFVIQEFCDIYIFIPDLNHIQSGCLPIILLHSLKTLLHFSHFNTVPAGKASNWIKTNRGENWFAYLRLYAPTESYFDRSWPMHDIEKVK